MWNFKQGVVIGLGALLIGCGGGGSSSGGGQDAQIVLVPTGIYEGTRTTSVNGRRDETGPFSISVTTNGNVQTARIAFREFSGTSVIGANQEFSIPSGDLDIGSGCVGSVTYDGRFEGSSVSGSETGRFVCPDGFLINLDGTFEATLQTAKRLPFVNEFNFTR